MTHGKMLFLRKRLFLKECFASWGRYIYLAESDFWLQKQVCLVGSLKENTHTNNAAHVPVDSFHASVLLLKIELHHGVFIPICFRRVAASRKMPHAVCILIFRGKYLLSQQKFAIKYLS